METPTDGNTLLDRLQKNTLATMEQMKVKTEEMVKLVYQDIVSDLEVFTKVKTETSATFQIKKIVQKIARNIKKADKNKTKKFQPIGKLNEKQVEKADKKNKDEKITFTYDYDKIAEEIMKLMKAEKLHVVISNNIIPGDPKITVGWGL